MVKLRNPSSIDFTELNRMEQQALEDRVIAMFLRNNIEEKNEEENLVLRVGRTKRRNRTERK